MYGIDLYSGAGGMSLGATIAGVDVKVAIEMDIHSATTYQFNHPNTKMIISDITDVSLDSIGKIDRNKPLIVFGGPPCQGFSISNRRNRNALNAKNWQFTEFFRIVKLFNPLPEWVVFENVRGFIDTEKGMFLNKVIRELNSLGYNYKYEVLNAADYGVPQVRNRFFLVANNIGENISFPEPLSYKRTVEDALDDLPNIINTSEGKLNYTKIKSSSTDFAKTMRNGIRKCNGHLLTKHSKLIIERFKHVPQGGNWENIPESLMKNYTDRSRCHTGIYRRLCLNQPSVVIGNFRKNMLIHPTEDRGLSIREAARLQSFPDEYEFKGGIGFQQQQVGNAVPPLLAKAVFDAIMVREDHVT